MRKILAIVFLMLTASFAHAGGHGPVFGLATPTNSQGEWSFDLGVFDRSAASGSEASLRGLIAYGFTPHLTLSVTAPVVIGSANLPPTRIQPGADFDSTLAWRFLHNTTRVGTRFESTAFAGVAVPGPQANFGGVVHVTTAPGNMVGAVTGVASRSHYAWLGATFTHFYERNNEQRPNVNSITALFTDTRPPIPGVKSRTNGIGACSLSWWASAPDRLLSRGQTYLARKLIRYFSCLPLWESFAIKPLVLACRVRSIGM